jgi:hypothetical protein
MRLTVERKKEYLMPRRLNKLLNFKLRVGKKVEEIRR